MSTKAETDGLLRPVKLVTVAGESQEMPQRFFGQTVARQGVDLSFQVGGQIVSLPVVEGHEIRAGDLIAQLDLDDFRLKRDQARLPLEQSRRTTALVGRNAASR